MSEQPPYKVTPEKGWAQMRLVLDRELPVDRRHKRRVFGWRLLTTALIFGVVGTGLFKGLNLLLNKPKADPAAMHSEVPPYENKSMPNTQPETESANEALPRALSPSGKELKTTEETTVHPVKSIKPTDVTTNKSSPLSKTPASVSKSAIPMASAEPKEGQLKDMGQMDLPSISVIPDKNQNTKSISAESVMLTAGNDMEDGQVKRNGRVFDPVPVLALHRIETAPGELDPIHPGTMLKNRHPRALRPYLALEGIAGQDGGLGGQASAGLDLHISGRFAFTSGVAYRSFNPHSTLLGTSRALESNAEANAILNHNLNYEGYNTYIEGDYLNAGTDYDAISPFVDAIRQWQVTGGLRWKVTRHLFTEGGLMYAFNTNVRSRYPIITGDPIVNSPEVRVTHSLNTYDLVRVSMTSWYAGMGYAFGRHLSLQARWTHGLEQYLLNDQQQELTGVPSTVRRSDYIRGLSLGLRYTL